MVFLFTEQENYEEAMHLWEEINKWLIGKEYEEDADYWQRAKIKKLREKLNNNK